MKRRTFLGVIASASISCDKLESLLNKEVYLPKEFFNRKNSIGEDSQGNTYLPYEIQPDKIIAIKVKSSKIDQYKPRQYIFKLPTSGQAFEGKRVYDLIEKEN